MVEHLPSIRKALGLIFSSERAHTHTRARTHTHTHTHTEREKGFTNAHLLGGKT
jgi:hypothetical protein